VIRTLILIVALTLGACINVDPPWQLAHDRIIAVRAEPPGIAAGGRAVVDALITEIDAGPAERAPDLASAVQAPQALAGAVTREGSRWIVTAPGEEALAAARTELSLPAGAPVPLRVGITVTVDAQAMAATKTVWLGSERTNPALGAITIGGAPATGEMAVPVATDVALAIDAGTTDEVDWLTSVGELDDADDAVASLRSDDEEQGHLAVVVRSEQGGVAWSWWSLRATR